MKYKMPRFLCLLAARLVSLLLFAAGVSSCAERDELFSCRDLSGETGEGALNIPFEVDGEMPIARGVVSQSHETYLQKTYLLFFDHSTEGEDCLVGYKAVTVGSGKKVFSFDPPTTLEPDTEYLVLALGNPEHYTSSGATAVKETLDEMIDDRTTYIEAQQKLSITYSDPVTKDDPSRMPMWGMYMDNSNMDIPFLFTKDADGNISVVSGGIFKFSRSICRVDICNLMGHVLDIKCARVVNYNTFGYYFNDNFTDIRIKEYEPASAPEGDVYTNSKGYMPITQGMNEGSTTQRLEGSLYCFPNMVGTSVVNDQITTALMIAGYYTDPETGVKDDDLTYYRFNLANPGEPQMLKRNYCYRATIKGVKERGADSEEEAYNSSTPIFEYDIDDEWDVSDENFVSDGDGNFLIINRSHLTFQGEASEADFVELRVSTNPELEWELEWWDVTGNQNSLFNASKLSDQAIKCGPKTTNSTDYVRYGYLRVVATNPRTGKKLSLPIYITQLSTLYNVKTLTVNGYTGRITQELNPMGGTISLEVVTGSNANEWTVTDDANMLISWDTQNVSYTPEGNNRTMLNITVPANMTKSARSATLIVSLKENDIADDGSKVVPDVTIELTQDPSPCLLDVAGMPTNGPLDIQCFSISPDNPNGVVNPKSFTVRLADSRLRYKVESDFDQYRDLVLSTEHETTAIATHPTTEPETYGMSLTGMITGTHFYINPFRTGPNDPAILGKIKVTAYMPDDESISETRTFSVRLLSEPVVIDDVFALVNDTYFMVPDRNYGATERHQDDGPDNVAEYYDCRSYVAVTNGEATNKIYPIDHSNYLGTYFKHYAHNTNNAGGTIQKWVGSWVNTSQAAVLEEYRSRNANVNEVREIMTYVVPTDNASASVMSQMCISKKRHFIVSRFKTTDGKYVCNWFPFYLGSYSGTHSGVGSATLCQYGWSAITGTKIMRLTGMFLYETKQTTGHHDMPYTLYAETATRTGYLLRPFGLLTEEMMEMLPEVYGIDTANPMTVPFSDHK